MTAAVRDHAECPDVLRVGMAELGVDVDVWTSPPAASPYAVEPFVCPHGVTHWIEPTVGQLEQWAREGVR